jgi:hypothetical protein
MNDPVAYAHGIWAGTTPTELRRLRERGSEAA